MALVIYDVALQMVRDVAPIARAIDRHDPDLARQLRRAASSVVLLRWAELARPEDGGRVAPSARADIVYLAEGAYSQGRNEIARFHNAMASAAEVGACLDVAEALAYVAPLAAEHRDRIGRIVATLRKLTHRR